tara:strand:+ start:138 stop:545 length:408 start_codon:yes stop_codon:yes gene_type:complete
MKIVGFNFTKLSVDKKTNEFKDLKIKTSVDIVEVRQIKPEVFQVKDNLIEISFKYDIDYNPDISKISLSGTVLTMMDQKMAKEFLKNWKKKKLPEEYSAMVLNIILRKSNIRALTLEDEMGLPSHLPLPSVKNQG